MATESLIGTSRGQGDRPTGSPSLSAAVALIRSEWTKLWSIRSTPAILLAAALIAVVVAGLDGSANADFYLHPTGFSRAAFLAGFDPLATSYNSFLVVQLVMGMLGVIMLSGEYGSGLIRTTLAAVPRRRTLLAAKAAVLCVVTLVIGEAASFASFFVAQATLRQAGLQTTLGHPGVLGGILAAGWYLFVSAAIGLGLAAVFRHTAAGVGALVTLLLIVPQIVRALPHPWNDTIGKFLPTDNVLQLTTLHPEPHQFTGLSALLICTAWAVVALAAGAFVLSKKDA